MRFRQELSVPRYLTSVFRRNFSPRVTSLSLPEAEVVKLRHVDRVEGVCASVDEVAWNVGKIVIDAIPFREHVEFVKIADALDS